LRHFTNKQYCDFKCYCSLKVFYRKHHESTHRHALR
jgi:hypothetical protein